MPVTFWIPAVTFEWPAKPVRKAAPKRKPKPATKPKAKKKPKKGRGKLSPQLRSTIDDRLEAAISAGLIELCDEDMGPVESLDFTLDELAFLQRILLPEEYLEPKRKARAAKTAPGSDARLADYAVRAERGQALYNTADARPGLVAGRGLKVMSRANGSGHKVLGWADETG